jgi:hypothetical protein
MFTLFAVTAITKFSSDGSNPFNNVLRNAQRKPPSPRGQKAYWSN